MTNETKQTTEKKPGKKPTHEIFEVGQDGKPNYNTRIAAWGHSKGGGMNFSKDGKRYVVFPVKPRTEQPAA